ncbi:transporter substrate-binding domain-containing protein [Schaalia turicensis]|uniref:transporter substrate-binding domain-containing protein n=1 Tax=Schaalia turicensis TaxID=131111 RepID=UPI0036A4664B
MAIAQTSRIRRRVLGGLSALAALTMALTGCSSPDLSGSGDSATDTAAGSGAGAENATVGARTPEQIKEAGSIRIGTFADKAPFGSLVGKNTYEGYDIVYGDRLGKDLGVKVEWVPVDASSRVEFLKSGKVDIILANFTVTPERAAQVDFANPYMKVSFGAVSSAKDPVRSEAELANKNIIIVKGTSQDAWITANHPEWKVTKYEQYTEATNALTDGRGDVWITDNTEALAFTEQNKDFVTGIASFGEESTIAAAVQQGNTELRDWINNNLVDLGKENFFHKDFEQTLAPVYGTAISPDELVIEGGAR